MKKHADDIRTVRLVWNWMCRNIRLVILLILLLMLTKIISGRIQNGKIEEAREQGRAAALAAEQLRAEEAAQLTAAAPLADGTSIEQAQKEAEYVAQVLIGTAADNSHAGKKLAVWCFISRMANPNYPDTAQGVANQQDQWMGFSSDNPVVCGLFDLAYEEIVYWHSGGYLPVTADYVFLEWTPQEITLRTSFDGSANCHYFYESDWETFEAARSTAE